MVFSSLVFLFVFLPVAMGVYFLLPSRIKNERVREKIASTWLGIIFTQNPRNLVLFITGLVFYAWGEPVYVLLMLFSTVVDYTVGLLIAKARAAQRENRAKIFVALSVIINLSLLGFFKYTDFFIGTVNSAIGTDIALFNLPLPIGISFYTFQTMSYSIDVYRGKAHAQRNIIDFGSYVVMFPQLIAGPIVQYNTVAKQLNSRKETPELFAQGILRFIIGLGKKVLLANNIGMLWDTISSQNLSETSVLTAWLGIIAFAFQIYFDFSGYSDMAIGLGKMMGFTFNENFNYPYTSNRITDFWRRWHISLSSWFRDYVYIPLGGNRCSKSRNMFNIFAVWALTGIWHGANWNFLIWGLYFAVILMAEKLFLGKWLDKLPRFVGHIYSLFLVLISWVIFACEDFNLMLAYLGTMFGLGASSFADSQLMYLLLNNAVLLIILAIGSTQLPKLLAGRLMNKLENHSAVYAIVLNIAIIAIFIMSVAYIVDASYNPFLYFRF